MSAEQVEHLADELVRVETGLVAVELAENAVILVHLRTGLLALIVELALVIAFLLGFDSLLLSFVDVVSLNFVNLLTKLLALSVNFVHGL